MQTQKCKIEMWFQKKSACVMRILRESRYAFTIRNWFNDFYFELFHGIFLLFHIHMELFFRHFYEMSNTFDSITPFDSDLT